MWQGPSGRASCWDRTMRQRAPTPPPAHPLRSGDSVAGAEWESVVLGSDEETESSDPHPLRTPSGVQEDDDDDDEDGWPLMMMRMMMVTTMRTGGH